MPESVAALLSIVGRVLVRSLTEARQSRAASPYRVLDAHDAQSALVLSEVQRTARSLAQDMMVGLGVDEPALTVVGDGLSITVALLPSLEANELGASSLLSFSPSLGPRVRSTVNGTVALRRMQWSVNPYDFVTTSRFVATGVVSVDVLDAYGTPVRLTSVGSPSTLTLPRQATPTSARARQCAYFDHDQQQWAQQGVVLIGYDAISASPVCATLHFTEFAGMQLPPAVDTSPVSTRVISASAASPYVPLLLGGGFCQRFHHVHSSAFRVHCTR